MNHWVNIDEFKEQINFFIRDARIRMKKFPFGSTSWMFVRFENRAYRKCLRALNNTEKYNGLTWKDIKRLYVIMHTIEFNGESEEYFTKVLNEFNFTSL